MIERLESRRLLSVSLESGTLTITGTDAGEFINVRLLDGSYGIYFPKDVRRFAASKIKRIVINGGGGDDEINFEDPFINANGNAEFMAGIPDRPVNATVFGGDGNDRITSGGGSDWINGGAGNDTIAGRGGADTMIASDGRDTIDYTEQVAVNVNLDGLANDGPNGGTPKPNSGPNEIFWPFLDHVGADFENITGGTGNDTLTGNAADNFFDGGGGAFDVLSGGAGNDTFRSGTGADDITGGPGIDTADYSWRTDDLTITLDDVANDGQGIAPAGEGDNVRSDIENVWGGSMNDSITGGKSDNLFAGGLGNDTLDGGAGNDTLSGNRGNDLLAEGSYPSALGTDLFAGGAGRDTAGYHVRTDNLTITLDGVANDGGLIPTPPGSAAPPLPENDNIWADVEQVIAGFGDDSITGNAANNALIGSDGHDTLIGLAGDDLLIGGPDLPGAQEGVGNVLDGGEGLDTARSYDFRDTVTSVERARVSGIVARYPDSIIGNTGWMLSRDEGFTDMDPAGHVSLAKKHLGRWVTLYGTIEMLQLIERPGFTPVFIPNWTTLS